MLTGIGITLTPSVFPGKLKHMEDIPFISPVGWHRGTMAPNAREACFFFTSRGKIAFMNMDGSSLRFLEFNRPNQITWQLADFFPDGNRILLLSMEQRRDGPGKSFEEYYTQTPTHIWTYDLPTGELTELATHNRMAVFYTPSLLLGEDRMLVQVSQKNRGQIFNMNLDGSDAQPFTLAGEGFPYGLSLSPDGQKVAFHIAGNKGYQVFTSDIYGKNRVRIAAKAGHLYFGTSWSPDGQWVLYADCYETMDPGHDWADVCIGRPDGSECHILTSSQSMWFAATYGGPGMHGGGSNLASWTRDGQILFPRRFPHSKVAWEYQPDHPDTDHFNRDYKPELSRGGVQICRINIHTGEIKALTQYRDGLWDFRASQSPDGKNIIFCRAETGDVPAIWIMDNDGKKRRRLTKGFNDQGADHPQWKP